MRARFSLIVLVAVATGSLACTSGHGSPSSSPPPSTHVSTPVTTPPPSSTAPVVPTVPADVPTTGPNAHDGERPPVMPVLATQHTPAGAQAFATFFIQTLDWAYATTSPTYMNHYYDAKTCLVCSGFADQVSRQATESRVYIGNRLSNYRAAAPSSGGPYSSEYLVAVTFDINSAEIVDKNGKYVNGAPAAPDFLEKVYVSWRTTGWVVAYMSHV